MPVAENVCQRRKSDVMFASAVPTIGADRYSHIHADRFLFFTRGADLRC